ncbi:hypothetical protein AJ80_02397 [Polytolypa hystricis UAMH7299]|uniref:Inner centromere protein ARK-binding domain-containing protein n=1 Tax=Polytolypa hystricis (strain UAMH7299) TaxID=1447883 RepID=A0A2B7YPM3_POLH7|nr:hypothetical protein AJ80_02397 [Polytolypa hystricis UAMH7299]
MAALGLKAQKTVGSSSWIAAEKENVAHLVDQEMEEAEYPALHELDWLNEHMAEIFSGNQLNVAEIFKTPAKLRGKTPRTIRKHMTPRTARVPLSDIFSSQQNVRNSPVPPTRFNQEIAKLAAPSPKQQPEPPKAPSPPPQSQNSNPTYNTDSGYHGMPDEDEDEMDMVQPDEQPEPETQATIPFDESTFIARDRNDMSPSVDRRTTDASFHSAREIAPSKESTVEPMFMEVDTFEFNRVPPQKEDDNPTPRATVHEQTSLATSNREDPVDHEHDPTLDHHLDDIGSPSEGSTPDRPLIRKSSLSFASLPAREPLTTKKSMGGARISRTSHVNMTNLNMGNQTGYFARQTGGPRITQILPEERPERAEGATGAEPAEPTGALHEDSDTDTKATKLHSKSSTQRLHEKISMLGKSQHSRSTKSIPSAPSAPESQVSYPELSTTSAAREESVARPAPAEPVVANENASARLRSPILSPPSLFARERSVFSPEQARRENSVPDRAYPAALHSASPDRRSPGQRTLRHVKAFHGKSASITSPVTSPRSNLASSHQRSQTVHSVRDSTTPTTSPKNYDGPLSASKSRLQSIMQTAKGLFSSSAGVSAAAKMETLSPTAPKSQPNLYPSISALVASPPRGEGRRTRSSTEREEKRKEREAKELQQQIEAELEKQKAPLLNEVHDPPRAPNAERSMRLKAPAPRSSPQKTAPAREAEPVRNQDSKFAVPSLPQPKQNEGRRPVRPTRETQKPKPQPVSIRVGTNSQRIPLSAPSISASVQDPAPHPTPASSGSAVKKGSNSSLQTTSSNSSFKSSTSSMSTSTKSSTKSRTALAAEKKKKEQQREAQRKLEQRKEAERKRATQQEEARRQQEQLNRAESERRDRERERLATDDPKKLAQKQAIERRRLENARKLEQQRNQQATPSGDTSVLHGSQRNDAGPPRPQSRLNSVQPSNRPIVHNPSNASKPIKRVIEDDAPARQATVKSGAVHQADGKRRKTDEEIVDQQPTRPTMAPPIRQSNVRRETKQQLFTHTYQPPTAPNPAGPALFKNPAGPRHFQPPSSSVQRAANPLEMAKYANGKIPFAEPSNQPHAAHKTPTQGSHKNLKSSPAYPNGEHIKLPEIPTDSEDDDSDAEPCHVPEWAKEENLVNLLIEQEGKDGEQVFGPSAPLHMEEIFKDNKDRLRRFRDRTSSANWSGPDGLTQDEVKWDLQERERLKKNGGWTFAP